MKIENYLHLYLGCDTNNGKLVAINGTTCLYALQTEKLYKQELNDRNQSIKPVLRKFSSMSAAESTELNNRGVPIDQRKRYSFTPDAILYLLGLYVDIFNLIRSGMAIDVDQNECYPTK